MSTDANSRADWKRAAAIAAVELVSDGMIVGIGTGSTATFRPAGADAGEVLAQAPSSRVVAQAANRETERRMDAGISQTVTGRSLCPPSQGTPMTH